MPDRFVIAPICETTEWEQADLAHRCALVAHGSEVALRLAVVHDPTLERTTVAVHREEPVIGVSRVPMVVVMAVTQVQP
jgi:hypothetical protein